MDKEDYLEQKKIEYLEKYHSEFLGYPTEEEMEENIILSVEYVEKLENENKELKEQSRVKGDAFMSVIKEMTEYAKTIDKAIKFIKEHAYYEDDIFLCDEEIFVLLEILKGNN